MKPVWMLWDFPLASIAAAGQFNDGYMFSVTKILLDAWPDARYNLVGTTAGTAWAALNRGADACYVSAIMTPERQRRHFMTQSLLVAPHSLVARKEIAGKLEKNAAGEVLPGSLFDRADLRGVIAQHGRYSIILDTLPEQRAALSNMTKVQQMQGTSNILLMLAANRGGYTIEYGALPVPRSYQHGNCERKAGGAADRRRQARVGGHCLPACKKIAPPRRTVFL